MIFDLTKIRQQFPALQQRIDGKFPVFLDGPGGTQVPQSVAAAMSEYLTHYNSNLLNSPFFAVRKTHEVVAEARRNAAMFVNAPEAKQILFGPSMSAITAHLSRSLARSWQAGDEIIVTSLDHYANVSFWQQAAADHGVKCLQARIRPDDCTLDYDHLESLISPKTRLIAFTLASNVTGSYTDAQRIIRAAKQVGALTYLDSVHAAPHRLLDVQALDCDFLLCSAYKFYGPHLAFAYGKYEHLESLTPYKVAPAPAQSPDCWEMGTKSFEALAGFNAAIDYLCSFTPEAASTRMALQAFYDTLRTYEEQLSLGFLKGAEAIPSMQIYGITDPARINERTPTFAFNLKGHHPQAVSDHLAEQLIATGAGHFYAQGVVDSLRLTESGGFVRAGFVHYNTKAEMERLLQALEAL